MFAAPGTSAIERSAACARCHPSEAAAWSTSQHAGACRAFDASGDSALLDPSLSAASEEGLRPAGVIGIAPLRQVIVAAPGGRLQIFDPAFDPARGERFSIFGAEARRPGDWGHWRGRGMNFNSQCAACHMTDLRKGYDPASDTYATSWTAAGIACAGCHGDMPNHERDPRADSGSLALRARPMDVCGACHSRREELVSDPPPQGAFDDRYRLFLADEPGLYAADGRAEDEDFELGSLLSSPMGQAGVTCLDCHDPHSGRLRASVDDDALCLGCHRAPGRRGAVSVDPASHSHHPPASAGARCVACHMPERVYMARDPRRDHAFSIPDPLLSKEIGATDTCATCHSDRPAGWTEAQVDRWYGDRMERPSRRRARAVLRARAMDRAVEPELLAVARSEPNVTWRAALIGLLGPLAAEEGSRSFLRQALSDPDARVRTAAIRALARFPDERPLLVPLREDPVRLARLFASWATRATLSADPAALREVEAWLRIASDQPAGAVRRSELSLVLGDASSAVDWARRAVAWDPSPPSYFTLARALSAAGETREAREAAEKGRAAFPP